MEMKRRIVRKIMQQLGSRLLDSAEQPDETVLTVDKEAVVSVCRYLREEQAARLFTVVGNDERPISGKFALYYVFALDKIRYFITIKLLIEERDPTFPSLTPYSPAFDWHEREINDLLGLRAQGHPNRAPLVFHGDPPGNFYPLRKDFFCRGMLQNAEENGNFIEYAGNDVTQIPVGPIHAGIIEPGHFRFGAVGDTVLHLDAKLFYTHRGIEKALEGKTIDQAIFLVERVCCVCNVSHAAAFSQAVERASQAVITERAQYIRTLYMELERLYNHVGDVGNICAGYGFAVGISNGARMREGLLQLNERISGHRYLRGVVTPGGIRHDLRKDEIDDILHHLDGLEGDFRDLAEIILDHEVAVDRMAGTGTLTRQQVTDFEAVGVAARAAGRDIDCRRDLPYASYGELDFSVIVKRKGDVLSRMKVRIGEVFQTILLIKQILAAVPEGDILAPIPPIVPYTASFGWNESARGENCHWIMFGENNTIYRYRIRSAAYSNWPVVPLAVAGNIVPDFPVINKSFELCYSCCDR